MQHTVGEGSWRYALWSEGRGSSASWGFDPPGWDEAEIEDMDGDAAVTASGEALAGSEAAASSLLGSSLLGPSLGRSPRRPSEDDEGLDVIHLAKLGSVDPTVILDAIEEISDKYLTAVEADLIHLMRLGRRPVEISRILQIPECEVVRLRRNCFRKIRVVFHFDYFHDKRAFLVHTRELLGLNDKQFRILSMFFDYHGLRPIAEAIGTRPSNVHRSLESIRKRLDQRLTAESPHRVFLAAFKDLKYLNVHFNSPADLPAV